MAPVDACKNRNGDCKIHPQFMLQTPRKNSINRIMIVCICNAITENQLRDAARKGETCPEAAYAALGKTPQCRICLDHADDILSDERVACRRQCVASRLKAPSPSHGTWATA